MTLDQWRGKIDAIDAELVRLLNERTRIALEIGKLKKEAGAEIYVPSRERAVLQRLEELNGGPLPAESLRAIYREIMSASLALERDLKIAYLGPRATFTHEAARSRFGGSVEYVSCSTIGDVFSDVENRNVDYGVVPIENSTEGAVTHTLDRFVDTTVRICAEIFLPISLNLLSRAGRESIARVYSKEEAFGQCRRWLNENLPGVEQIPVGSTASAAERAAREEDSAAIAGWLASDLYGISVLERNIQDVSGNVTRFLVLGRSFSAPTGKDKTSILFSVKHKAGALYDALSVFSGSGVNMTRIESRPNRTKAWEYNFFVDFEGHAEDEEAKRTLEKLSEHCLMLRVLGSYPNMGGTES
ncbi:prephenate dehydratase [Kiritimatiella glycovorans]|uniref:Bifunctional chorismate mutase/prephenate dehydratase n=1 Tax=Kiritimatiella glycovorans TaxID=1307763 RepID=A0A0G3EJB6_9BACT|nr:prephenate dehydratase [Kiritimatiella glycovorans]AKJ64274.1 P-protein [Kiritimatiella glycovorans]